MLVLYPPQQETMFDQQCTSRASSQAALSTCVKFRSAERGGEEMRVGGEGGEVESRLKGLIKRQRGTWKRKRSLICGEMEQEIVVWGIIYGGGGELEEKSNHKLKGPVWRGAIYQRMRLKALSFFLSPHSAPSGSRGCRGWERGERDVWQGWEPRAVSGLLTCSLAKRGSNVKSTGYRWFSSHSIGDSDFHLPG